MLTPSNVEAIKVAHRIVSKHLELKRDEEVVIVCDTYTEGALLDALAGAILAVGAEFTIVKQAARTGVDDHHKLTRSVLKSYEGADVIIHATGASGVSQYGGAKVFWPMLTERRARVFSLSQRSIRELSQGAALADYDSVEETGRRIVKALEGKGHLHVTTASGSDIVFGISQRDVINLAGFSRSGGDEGGLPSGEVTIDPAVGTTEGVLVVDGPIGYVGRPAQPIELVARGGEWVEVRGTGPEADRLREIFETIPNSRNVAEIAIGTNPLAQRTGSVNEEKKRLGTIHTAFGRSTRTADWHCEVWSTIHGDIVVYQPTIEADGVLVMSAGELVV